MSAGSARRRLRVRGQVQGVGFRPFVYRIAVDAALAGWVRNDGEGVELEVEGPRAGLADFELINARNSSNRGRLVDVNFSIDLFWENAISGVQRVCHKIGGRI